MGVCPQMNWPGEISSSSCLERSRQRSASGFAAAVGYEDVGSVLGEDVSMGDKFRGEREVVDGGRGIVHFETVLVLPVENFHGFDGLWDGLAASYQDTVDIESKREFVCRRSHGRCGWRADARLVLNRLVPIAS